MPRTISLFKISVSCFLLVTLSACLGGNSGSVRFYVLSSLAGQQETSGLTSSKSRTVVEVGPVALPSYLDREGVVTRVSANSVHFAPFDEWAEPLEDGFTRVLVENLMALLPGETFTVVPSRGPNSADYRVEVEVFRFDGMLGGPVSLMARWRVYQGDQGKLLLTKDSSFQDSAKGKGYEGLTAALSRTVEALSREIAVEIETLAKRQ